jgi:hypothetical protein
MKRRATRTHDRTQTRRPRSRWIPGILDVDLKRTLVERARANPGAAPPAKAQKKAKPPAFIFLKPVCDGGDCPDPSDDPPPKDPCAGLGGDSFQRTITLRIKDEEGSTAIASRTVTITVNESDDLPPICQIKPWLPQCNPGAPRV